MHFLTFAEAVDVAKTEPGVELVGLRYAVPYTRLDVYLIRASAEGDHLAVEIDYEGGELFGMGGEEESYDLANVPNEAKNLFYARKSALGNGAVNIAGMVPEFILQEVLPGLRDQRTHHSDAEFIRAASVAYRSYWRQV